MVRTIQLMCIFTLLAFGVGCSDSPAAPACGDGTVNEGEVCDDGNTEDGDGCSADCQSDESCGNSLTDTLVGEVCDDGNSEGGDGCSADCMSDETCGNSFTDTALGEACDDGNNEDGDGCSADCTSDESCGNGILDPGEVCDNGDEQSWCIGECTMIAKSCADVLAGSAMAPADGVYTVDPDAEGPLAEIDVYCDMTIDSGGWTLTLKVQGGSTEQPWFNVALIGDNSDLPTTVDRPAVLSEGPSMADRSMYVTAMGATEYRATLYDAADALVVDVASMYMGDDGRGLRCFAMGEPDCMGLQQTCSPANTDARMVSSNGASNFADGDTGHLCDIGWWDCDTCVDWSWISKTASQGSQSPDNVVFACDDAYLTTDDYTLFWVR